MVAMTIVKNDPMNTIVPRVANMKLILIIGKKYTKKRKKKFFIEKYDQIQRTPFFSTDLRRYWPMKIKVSCG